MNCDDKNKFAIGIDLGTTNCCVSVWKNDSYNIVHFDSHNTLPSIVALSETEIFCGNDVIKYFKGNVKDVFYEVKRLLGKKYSEIDDINLFSYEITTNENDEIILKTTFGKCITPEEIVSLLLIHIKHRIENVLQTEIVDVVITIPAYFDDNQRRQTQIAAEMAGLNTIRIINEPTAASLLCGLHDNKNEKNVLIYDIGGGTVDVSLVNVDNGVFSVLATAGNSRLGGRDFDLELMKYCIEEFAKIHNEDSKQLTCDLSSIAIEKLKKNVENAKKQLTLNDDLDCVLIKINDFYKEHDLLIKMTRTLMIDICSSLIHYCMLPVTEIIDEMQLSKMSIDGVVCVGGMSRMQIIRETLYNITGQMPNINYNPDEIVAIGASIQAYILLFKDDPFSKNITLLDVTPLSLGVELEGGIMNIVIPRNTNIPIKESKMYSNSIDNETKVQIKVYEGEREFTKDNILIGEFELADIDKLPKGSNVIEICFSIDVNGMLTIVANDKLKTNSNSIVVSNKQKKSAYDIAKMVADSEKYKQIDKINCIKKQKFMSFVDLINSLKHSIADCQKIILTQTQHNSSLPFSKKLLDNAIEFVTSIDKLFEEKQNCFDYEIDFLEKQIEIVKNNFELLILNSYSLDNSNQNDEQINLKAENEDKMQNLTSIYEDEKMENCESINRFVNHCKQIINIISSDTINLQNDDKTELLKFVDDLLHDIYTTQLDDIDCDTKIAALNIKCNEYYDKNKQNILLENVSNLTRKMEFLTNFDDLQSMQLLNKIATVVDNIVSNNCVDIDDKLLQQCLCEYDVYYQSKLNL
jgi:heat shock protein 1/8